MWKSRAMLLLLAAAGAWGWAMASLLPEAVRRVAAVEADTSVRRGRDMLLSAWRAEVTSLVERVRVAADDPGNRTDPEDSAAAEAVVARLSGGSRHEDWALLSAGGVVQARSSNTGKRGASLASEPVVAAALKGEVGRRVGAFEGEWRILATAPVRAADASLAGVVLGAVRLDSALASSLGKAGGADAVLAAEGRVLGSTLPADPADAFRHLLARGDVPGGDEPRDLHLASAHWRTMPVDLGGARAFLLRKVTALAATPNSALEAVGLRGLERWVRPEPLAAGIAFVVAFFLALLALRLETSGPLLRLAGDVRRLSSDPAREMIAVRSYTGPLKRLARDVQALADGAVTPEPVPAFEREAPEPEEDARLAAGELFVPGAQPVPAEEHHAAEAEAEALAAEAEPEEQDPESELEAMHSAIAELRELAAELPVSVEPEPSRAVRPGPSDKERTTLSEVPDEEAHDGEATGAWQALFEDFLEARRDCGEATADVTYERFVRKVERNRGKLLRTIDCSDVKFRVEVKDGRATLKAIPVRSQPV